MTGEKALPVLQAAHIRPVSAEGQHELSNGLLLRSDVHTLFDKGYVTVTPEERFRVSSRLHSDFDDGEHYFALDQAAVALPRRSEHQPSRRTSSGTTTWCSSGSDGPPISAVSAATVRIAAMEGM